MASQLMPVVVVPSRVKVTTIAAFGSPTSSVLRCTATVRVCGTPLTGVASTVGVALNGMSKVTRELVGVPAAVGVMSGELAGDAVPPVDINIR